MLLGLNALEFNIPEYPIPEFKVRLKNMNIA